MVALVQDTLEIVECKYATPYRREPSPPLRRRRSPPPRRRSRSRSRSRSRRRGRDRRRERSDSDDRGGKRSRRDPTKADELDEGLDRYFASGKDDKKSD